MSFNLELLISFRLFINYFCGRLINFFKGPLLRKSARIIIKGGQF